MAVKCILTGQTPSVLDGVTENVQTQLNGKVDKVTGKGLSTNDYTSAEKTKLSGIETGAQKNTITGVKGSAETTYRTGNVNITATNIGLGNVDNTSDANKPISNATQAALNDKQAKITANGLLKGNGSGGVTTATKGTDYAGTSKTVTATILAANWTGSSAPYTYTLAVTGVTANSNQELLPALNITEEQLTALQAANIQDGGQAANSVTLTAFGDKPTINLPIRVIVRGDS